MHIFLSANFRLFFTIPMIIGTEFIPPTAGLRLRKAVIKMFDIIAAMI
ncbi:MAG: hypothetical protein HY762_04770 [Planctomycetes bacterium]|nr:hypothetical protein [Planctomycetota bacterium]